MLRLFFPHNLKRGYMWPQEDLQGRTYLRMETIPQRWSGELSCEKLDLNLGSSLPEANSNSELFSYLINNSVSWWIALIFHFYICDVVYTCVYYVCVGMYNKTAVILNMNFISCFLFQVILCHQQFLVPLNNPQNHDFKVV